jgi:hypothetical protein
MKSLHVIPPARVVFCLIASALFAIPAAHAGDTKTWNFDDVGTGTLPTNFAPAVGDWLVVQHAKGKVLSQTARNPDKVFNVLLVRETSAKDLSLSVRLRPIAGEDDQGGGVVWRAKDAKNYYIARYNPLEKNFRLYTIVDGKRTLLQNADTTLTEDWCELKITMKGDHITCSLNGSTLLDVHDQTFPDAGMIGLWSKADAQTEFDDLTLEQD